MPAPDNWTLAGGGISIHYLPTRTPGVFHYLDITGPRTFTGPQIRAVPNDDLGMLISVTLNLGPVAETTLTVLLPAVVLDATHLVEPVLTSANISHRLLNPPRGQKQFYTVIPLSGSATLQPDDAPLRGCERRGDASGI